MTPDVPDHFSFFLIANYPNDVNFSSVICKTKESLKWGNTAEFYKSVPGWHMTGSKGHDWVAAVFTSTGLGKTHCWRWSPLTEQWGTSALVCAGLEAAEVPDRAIICPASSRTPCWFKLSSSYWRFEIFKEKWTREKILMCNDYLPCARIFAKHFINIMPFNPITNLIHTLRDNYNAGTDKLI